MSEKKVSFAYKIIFKLIKTFYPKTEAVGAQNIPEEASIIVGNHTQLHGPVVCELYSPVKRFTWCAAQMMDIKEVPAYAYEDFWSKKSRFSRPFYKVLSYIIAPLSVCIFNNANTIGVYHDARILSTFKKTISALQDGAHVVIFPEHDVKYNHIIYDFQDRFIDVAKLYHRRCGKEVSFVPMYIAPKMHKVFYGKPIRYNASNPPDEERRRICDYLMREITDIAVSLPEHTVVPYRNIPKKYYPKNIEKETYHNEKNDG